MGGTQCDHGNVSNLSSNNTSESEGENNTSRKGENNAGRKSEGNIDGKSKGNNSKESGKNDAGAKGENNDGRKSKDVANRNNETLNGKLKVRNTDETSNLGEITANKLVFDCITNFLVDTPLPSTIASNHFAVPTLCSAALSFLSPSCLALGLLFSLYLTCPPFLVLVFLLFL